MGNRSKKEVITEEQFEAGHFPWEVEMLSNSQRKYYYINKSNIVCINIHSFLSSFIPRYPQNYGKLDALEEVQRGNSPD